MRLLNLLIVIALTSCCRPYKAHFDCPINEGAPCTSMTKIESLIVETEEGQDIFIGSKWGHAFPRPNKATKIWVSPFAAKNEGIPEGYINLLEECGI